MAMYHAKCGGTHQTVAEARECAGIGYGGEQRTYAPQPSRVPNARSARPATEPQVRFIRSLSADRDVPDAGRTPEEANLWERQFDILGWGSDVYDPEHDKFVSIGEASDVINWLKSFPLKSSLEPTQKGDVWAGRAPKGNQDEVPAGRYALACKDGVVRFYQVDKPTEGRWTGYIFVKALIGSPGDWRKERLNAAVRPQILSAIAADVQGALALFGRKTQTCGACHSPLSTPQSRAAGYGAICANKHGYWYPSEAEARAILNEMAGAE